MDTMNSQTPYARDEGLVIQELPDEVLVYDLDRHRSHCLNPTASAVWRLCDGQKSVSEIARRLEAELSHPVGDEMVWLALDRLEKAHLLRERLARPRDPAYSSRRALLRKLGLAGGLAVLLPVVESIVSPVAAQAGTLIQHCVSGLECHCCALGSHTGLCCSVNGVSGCRSGCTSGGQCCNDASATPPDCTPRPAPC